MQKELIYFIIFLVLSLILTIRVIKRMGKSGCLGYGYIGLLIFSIDSLAVASVFFMYTSISNIYKVTTSGETYTATVISFTTEQHYDDEDDRYYDMYQPTVQFLTNNGEVIERELEFSTSDMDIGDTYRINYNSETDEVITLGFTLVITFFGALIFFVIFSFLIVGIVIYALGYDMTRYKAMLSKVGFYFLIPFLMIGFDILLIYGIFYGNDVPWFVTLILIFFVLVLTLAIVGYFKSIISKGKPKMKKIAPNRWVGQWQKRIEK